MSLSQKTDQWQTQDFWFVHPKSFDAREILPIEVIHRGADADYLVHNILRGTARGKADRNGYVPQKADLLEQVMQTRTRRRVIEALLETDVIERSTYQVGVKSFGYRMHERFIDDEHRRSLVGDPRVKKALAKYYSKAIQVQQSRWKEVHHDLMRSQRGLTVDRDQAREILSQLPPRSNPFDRQGILIDDIYNRNFYLSVSRYDRVTNNISSLKTDLRAALRHNGRPLACVDLKNSQAALLAKRIQAEQVDEHRQGQTDTQRPDHQHTYSEHDLRAGDDLATFCQLTSEGRFYEELESMLLQEGHVLTRKQVKKRFLIDILAKARVGIAKADYPSVVESVFAKHFPTVHAHVRRINCDGFEHANLIRILQRDEAALVIGEVAADLMRNTNALVLSLHDAIFTGVDDAHHVEAAFRRAFERQRFSMKTETKPA